MITCILGLHMIFFTSLTKLFESHFFSEIYGGSKLPSSGVTLALIEFALALTRLVEVAILDHFELISFFLGNGTFV